MLACGPGDWPCQSSRCILLHEMLALQVTELSSCVTRRGINSRALVIAIEKFVSICV